MKDKAQEEWTDELLRSFESESTSKERWGVYRKSTDKKTEHTVLPLLDANGTSIHLAKFLIGHLTFLR